MLRFGGAQARGSAVGRASTAGRGGPYGRRVGRHVVQYRLAIVGDQAWARRELGQDAPRARHPVAGRDPRGVRRRRPPGAGRAAWSVRAAESRLLRLAHRPGRSRAHGAAGRLAWVLARGGAASAAPPCPRGARRRRGGGALHRVARKRGRSVALWATLTTRTCPRKRSWKPAAHRLLGSRAMPSQRCAEAAEAAHEGEPGPAMPCGASCVLSLRSWRLMNAAASPRQRLRSAATIACAQRERRVADRQVS